MRGMKIIGWLVVWLLLAAGGGCGRAAPETPPSSIIVTNIRTQSYAEAQYRDGVPVWLDGTGTMEQGNSWLFGGLLCLSGERRACEALEGSLAGHNRPCRAPWRYLPTGCSDTQDSFSRDEVLGMLAAAVGARKLQVPIPTLKTILLRWGEVGLGGAAKFCPDATDSRCTPTPQILGLLNRVLGRTSAYTLTDDTALLASAKTAPTGFQLHLVAIQLYLRQAINQHNNTLATAARVIVGRQGDNPFFRVVAGDFSAAEQKLFKAWECRLRSQEPKKDWFIQRMDEEQACARDSYHSFLFLTGLLK